MPQISFLTPAALALLVLLPVLWVVALAAPRHVARWRTFASLGLRSLILLALVLALAGTQITIPQRSLTTIFLIDHSDSVSQVQRDQAAAYVASALEAQSPQDRTGIIVFGQNALVERAPAQLAALGRLTSTPIGLRTNLQDAIQLGLALFPEDTQKRLVLLSDGSENSGNTGNALQLARARSIPLDTVVLSSASGPDVLVRRVETPATAREGQELGVTVVVEASQETSGDVQVLVDGQVVMNEVRRIPAGESSITLTLPAGASGFRQIEARVEAVNDSTAQNNRAAALTEVQGPPRILIIASDPTRAATLAQALRASGTQPEVVAPTLAPASLTQLRAYAGVILFDTAARDLPRALLQTLPTYVRDLGGGLAMVGGQRSFGAGGYRRTAIESIMPVALDPLDFREQPDVALAMVIDRSGSMGELAGTGQRNKLDLAKEAVYQASLGLAQQDQVGLVVFDEQASWALALQKLPDAATIEQALSTFGPGGGTDIRPGLELAAQALASATARIKHVILLTDGIADSNYIDVVEQLKSQGVTISTVAVGDDADPNLRDVATQGGGRYYQVRQVDDIPNIFLQETVIIAGRDIIEQEITPEVVLSSPFIRSLGGFPTLRGYNGTEQKPTARTLLVTPDGKPILAQEQIGLGRTVAWTSDLDGRWSNNWLGWQNFARFASGFADLLIPPQASENLDLQASRQGELAVFELTARDTEGEPINNAVLVGSLVDPNLQATALNFTQVGPGRYRATAPANATGVYQVEVAASDANGASLGTVSAGLAISYSPEYSTHAENQPLLREIAADTGGRFNPEPSQAYDPLFQRVGSVRELGLSLLLLALLLLPFDIAVRRLFVPLRSLFPARAQPASAPAAPDPTFSRLSAAKRRAQPTAVERPAATVAASQPAPPEPAQPPTPPVQPAPTPVRQPQTAKQAAAMSDDQFARLLAAKRRARGENRE